MANLANKNLLDQIRLQSVGHDSLQANLEQFEALKKGGLSFTDTEPPLEKAEGSEKPVKIEVSGYKGKTTTHWLIKTTA